MLKILLNIIKKLFTPYYDYSEDINLLKCEKLYWAINSIIEYAVYQKDSLGRGSTYCNVVTYDLLDSRCTAVWNVMVKEGNSIERPFPMGNTIKAFDYDIRPIMPNRDYNKILNAPIPTIFDNALIAAKNNEIRLLTEEEAQEKANKGIPCMIVSKEFDHVAIACPHLKWNTLNGKMELLPYDNILGCFTGQAGENNGLMYMSDKKGFGSLEWNDPNKILYIQFKLFTTGEFED